MKQEMIQFIITNLTMSFNSKGVDTSFCLGGLSVVCKVHQTLFLAMLTFKNYNYVQPITLGIYMRKTAIIGVLYCVFKKKNSISYCNSAKMAKKKSTWLIAVPKMSL